MFGAGDDIHASLNDNDTAKELTKHSELSEKLLQEAEEMRKMRSELIALRRERSQVQQQSRTLVESALVRVREGGVEKRTVCAVYPCDFL